MSFSDDFRELTDNSPFPWQESLYQRFIAQCGETLRVANCNEEYPDNIPSSCNLPTGLGKTAVVAIWLIALANHPDLMPRRLVYVVNRRTVVDQTTTEVEKLRERLGNSPRLQELRKRLVDLCALPLDDHKDEPIGGSGRYRLDRGFDPKLKLKIDEPCHSRRTASGSPNWSIAA